MATSSSTSSAVACASKICFNPDCKQLKSEPLRKGWKLRSGESVDLCERCFSVFEEGRFCEVFHSNAEGWRSCKSCGKRVHCGCIVSVHTFVLLDAGGVECMGCARKNYILSSNPIWQSSWLLPLPLPERVKDSTSKNWNQVTGSGPVLGQWRSAPNFWPTVTNQNELHPRVLYDPDRANNIEKLMSGEHKLVSVMEKKKFEQVPERLMPTHQESANGYSAIDLKTFNRPESGDVIHSSEAIKRENDHVDMRKGLSSEPGRNKSLPGIIGSQTNSYFSIPPQSSSLKDDTSMPHFGLHPAIPSPNKTDESARVSGNNLQQRTTSSGTGKQLYSSSHQVLDSPGDPPNQVRNGRGRGEGRGRTQLLPRYWPRITDQELQQISGDSNSVITPLFEKILSASDAGRVGRLVLPKKCAEAYFPTISQPEGLPLRVQDAGGKEWIFQFRFWPNNNSRMYVLEGVTPCIQSMQLQAGDTVTFSRIDPEGKLVMGFRKASTTRPEQETKTTKNEDGSHGTAEGKKLAEGCIAKDSLSLKSSIFSSKKKSSTLGSKSKRLRIENEESIELKLTWEEAQELLRPPPNNVPSIVVIEGYEFEEYEEAPVLGKPTIFTRNQLGEKAQWAQCEECFKWRKVPTNALLSLRWTCSDNAWDAKRSSCSSSQELSTDQLQDLLSYNMEVAKKKKTKGEPFMMETSDGLDTLADLAMLVEGDSIPPSSQTTTKHPRHRDGCTCIVCIQPPSGKGPKHKQSCTCNVCLTVKRRFRTLMLRREKRQSEKEAETVRKSQDDKLFDKQESEVEEHENNENSDSPNHKSSTVEMTEDYESKKTLQSPLKCQIDLNIQPEREDESSPHQDTLEVYSEEKNLACLIHNCQPLVTSIDQDDENKEIVDDVPCNSCHVDNISTVIATNR